MAKTKAVSILEIEKLLKKKKLLPIYYLFGEDSYGIDSAAKIIEDYISPFITSEFDKEVIFGENQTFSSITGLASTFPFGSEKKLLVVKQAEKVKSKKDLVNYIKSPAEFTVLIFLHDGPISSIESEPFKSLMEQQYLFEAKDLKGKNLVEWLISEAEKKNKTISYENAQLLTDISGESKTALESQLEKIVLFIGDSKEISIESIRDLSTALKQYTIFDLQNAIGKKNIASAFKVSDNLLKNGMEPVQIFAMINKYFTGLARISELSVNNKNEYEIARNIGTHPYYLKDYYAARKNYSDKQLQDVFAALFKADKSLKTTSTDQRTLVSILISEIIPE